jgi:hypothetical protein
MKGEEGEGEETAFGDYASKAVVERVREGGGGDRLRERCRKRSLCNGDNDKE